MSDVINVRRALMSLEKQETFSGYSKVVIAVSDDLEYSAGADTGRIMRLECPWGTQKMANDILAKVRGFQYQPYTAVDALLDPAAELGDGFSAGNVYGGIYKKDVSHGPLYTANVSAPGGEKINYKYEYKSPTTRKIERQHKEVKASLAVMADQILAEVKARESDTKTLTAALNLQADQISAKVSRSGGNSASFGWNLTADGWTLTSGGGTVLKADKSGLSVTGKITATSGVIGGLTIKDGYLSTNGQTWGGTNTNGIYFGPNGIQLGKYFKVDSGGNLYAYSGTFDGTIYAGNIQYGGSAGYFDGAGLASFSVGGGQIGTDAIVNRHITSGSVYPSTCNSTINGYFADVIYANKVFAGAATVDYLGARTVSATNIKFAGNTVTLKNVSGTRCLAV